ncbi:MAG: MFS transporter [Thermoleophilia bacterium]
MLLTEGEAIRNLPLLRVLGAQGLSSLGTSVSTVALAVMVFEVTGSVLHMGGILASATFPLVVMSFAGGAFLDRFEARKLMVVADLARAVLILLMPFAAARSVGLVYVVAGTIGVFSSIFNPSQVKLVGEVARREDLVRVNSYLSIAREGFELAGYMVGGALVVSIGYFSTFLLDGLTYMGSALCLIGVPKTVRPEHAPSLARLLRESPRALAEIWRHVDLRANLLFALFPMTAIMMTTPNAYGLALDVYDVGARGFSLMEILTSAGWIAGGVLASRLNYQGDRNTYVFVSIIVMAAAFALVGLAGSFWLSVAFLVAAAVANVGVIVGSMTLYQELDPRPDKGRILSVRAGFGQLASTGGLLAGGALGSVLGITNLFVLVGVLSGLLACAVYLPYRVARPGETFVPAGATGVEIRARHAVEDEPGGQA